MVYNDDTITDTDMKRSDGGEGLVAGTELAGDGVVDGGVW